MADGQDAEQLLLPLGEVGPAPLVVTWTEDDETDGHWGRVGDPNAWELAAFLSFADTHESEYCIDLNWGPTEGSRWKRGTSFGMTCGAPRHTSENVCEKC